MNKKELLNKSCIGCEHFCWWDGDYCCIAGMQTGEEGAKTFILQESPDGLFDENTIEFIKKHKGCKFYKRTYKSLYKEAFKEFLTSYEL